MNKQQQLSRRLVRYAMDDDRVVTTSGLFDRVNEAAHVATILPCQCMVRGRPRESQNGIEAALIDRSICKYLHDVRASLKRWILRTFDQRQQRVFHNVSDGDSSCTRDGLTILPRAATLLQCALTRSPNVLLVSRRAHTSCFGAPRTSIRAFESPPSPPTLWASFEVLRDSSRRPNGSRSAPHNYLSATNGCFPLFQCSA